MRARVLVLISILSGAILSFQVLAVDVGTGVGEPRISFCGDDAVFVSPIQKNVITANDPVREIIEMSRDETFDAADGSGHSAKTAKYRFRAFSAANGTVLFNSKYEAFKSNRVFDVTQNGRVHADFYIEDSIDDHGDGLCEAFGVAKVGSTSYIVFGFGTSAVRRSDDVDFSKYTVYVFDQAGVLQNRFPIYPVANNINFLSDSQIVDFDGDGEDEIVVVRGKPLNADETWVTLNSYNLLTGAHEGRVSFTTFGD